MIHPVKSIIPKTEIQEICIRPVKPIFQISYHFGKMLDLYNQWQTSGKNKTDFAVSHDIRPTTFYYWTRKSEKAELRTGREDQLRVFMARKLSSVSLSRKSPKLIVCSPESDMVIVPSLISICRCCS